MYFSPDHCAYPLSDHEPVLAELNIYKSRNNKSNGISKHKQQVLKFGKSTSILLKSFPYHTLIQPSKLISFFTMNWKDFESDSWKWTYGTFGILINICRIDANQYSFTFEGKKQLAQTTSQLKKAWKLTIDSFNEKETIDIAGKNPLLQKLFYFEKNNLFFWASYFLQKVTTIS